MEDSIKDALWISTIMSKGITCSFVLVLILHTIKKKYLHTAVQSIKEINTQSIFMLNIITVNMKDT